MSNIVPFPTTKAVKLALVSVAIIVAALSLIGCEPDQASVNRTNAHDVERPDMDRFVVEKVQTVRDDFAYDGYRGVYFITDTSTGQKWVGVSGIGISELGSHTVSHGKTSSTEMDER